MDEENKIIEEHDEPKMDNDALKEAIETQFEKIRRQSMLLGAQVMCHTILDKITVFERKPGSKSNNDHKRLIKEIKQFCEVGISRKVNTDGETDPIEQNDVTNNTELMEDANEGNANESN